MTKGRPGLQMRNTVALGRCGWGWGRKGEMNPRDSMREVLTKFGTDPPQAQGNPTEMGKLRRTPIMWQTMSSD